MRLLSANTLSISNYFGDIPPYAILSHVWGDEEVSLKDFEGGKADGLRGYAKILSCCKQAIADGLEHVVHILDSRSRAWLLSIDYFFALG